MRPCRRIERLSRRAEYLVDGTGCLAVSLFLIAFVACCTAVAFAAELRRGAGDARVGYALHPVCGLVCLVLRADR